MNALLLRTTALLVTTLAALSSVPAEAALLRYEYAGAHRYLARVQMLAERLSKENLLTQFNLAPERRLGVVETTEEIDAALERLLKGNALLGVPRPPTPEIQEQLARLQEIWAPMRANALVNPYRQRWGQFALTQDSQSVPPVLVLHFDHLAAQVVGVADSIARLYLAECKNDGYATCDLDINAGNAHRLSEQIVKDAVFVYTDINADNSRERLLERMEAFDRAVNPPETRHFLDEAMSFDRGGEAEYVRELQSRIEENWPRLRREAQLVADRKAERENLVAAVRYQRLIVEDLERLTVAMLRFAIVEQGGKGLITPP